ncbi:unnamed protein product [Phytomonas sp. EM1]|nr:unnamed protein product [Phytomonas sp. EM1]|eukprot:CCW60020.1 unnamed protein product [Phytomonas sp. isolate EM1]
MGKVSFFSESVLSKISPQLSSPIRLFHTHLRFSAPKRCCRSLFEFTRGDSYAFGVGSAVATTRRFNPNGVHITPITQHPEYVSKLTELNESFEEARELIKDSFDSAGTVYFAEDLNDAKEQTNKTLEKWKELVQWLEDRGEVLTLEQFRRETTLKMNQLEEELDAATCKGQS